MHRKSRSIVGKLLLSAAAVGTAAGIAGLGTFASFTSSTSASNTVSSGSMTIALGANGGANRLTVSATNVAPGDTIQRAVDLANTGGIDFSAVTMTTTASPSSVLDTDATNGLKVVVDSCPTAWTEAGTAPAYTYSCSGTPTTIVASRAVIGSAIPMGNLNSLTAGASDHLRFTLSLPTTADNNFQGKTSTISYAFDAAQRAGTNR